MVDQESETAPPTCVLVDDHPALRAGLRLKLELEAVVGVVAEAGSGDEGLRLIRTLRPDVALVDMRLPGMSGIELIEAARESELPTRIVLLTALGERDLVERAFAAGADGYVSKDSELEVVVQAVQVALSGRRFVDPSVAAALLDPAEERLTPRELEVLRLMGNGSQNKVIAFELGLGEETVKTHVATIMRKLGATSRTEVVALALRRSLID